MKRIAWVIKPLFIGVASFVSLVAGLLALSELSYRFSGHEADMRVRTDLQTLDTALHIFQEQNGRFPTQREGLRSLVRRPEGSDFPDYVASLKREILDPWKSPFRYVYPPVHHDDTPDVSSAGKDGEFDTNDDYSNWSEDRGG